MALPAVAFGYGSGGNPELVTCAKCHIDPYAIGNAPRGPHAAAAGVNTQCKTCHWTAHDAVGDKLLFASSRVSVCRACHDGTGGYGIYVMSSFGLTPGATHGREATSVVPGGSASTGGSATGAFGGVGGTLTCTDCHTPHGNNTVAPFSGTRARMYSVLNVPVSDRLLKQRPTGAETTVTQYGSDWCMGCHKGRSSGGTVHNHPVDSSLANANPFTYNRILTGTTDWTVPMAVSADGSTVFVGDTGNWRIESFTSDGAFNGSWATPNGGVTGGLALTKNAANQWTVAVADGAYSWGQLQRFTLGGAFDSLVSGTFNSSKDNPPTGLADVTAGNRLTVLSGDIVAQCFTGGTYHGYAGAWTRPMGIATAGDASWIVDAGDSRIVCVVFSDTPVNGNPGTVRYYYPGSLPASGSAPGRLSNPMAISRNPVNGDLFVADTGNDRVQVFSSTTASISPSPVAIWGGKGTGPGQFDHPAGIAVSPDGQYVYVADRGNSRIQKFTVAGAFQNQWGSLGSGNGQFGFGRAQTKPLGAPLVEGQPTGFAGGTWEGMLMADPRLGQQKGHGPICQQCHSDSGDPGTLVNGIPVYKQRTYLRDNGGWGYYWQWMSQTTTANANPRYPGFPHETENDNMVVRTGDGLCLDCHAPQNLP